MTWEEQLHVGINDSKPTTAWHGRLHAEVVHIRQKLFHAFPCWALVQMLQPYVHAWCREWAARAGELLQQGTGKLSEVEALLLESEQFLWGPADVRCTTLPLLQRLHAAKAWAAQVCGLHNRHCCGRLPALQHQAAGASSAPVESRPTLLSGRVGL